jgi:glycogen(starch) synthase
MKALKAVFPDIQEDEVNPKPQSRMFYSYPRPFSEPPSPSSSRVTTPAPSNPGSDDEDQVLVIKTSRLDGF